LADHPAPTAPRRQLSLRKKLLFTGIATAVVLIVSFAVAEIVVRFTKHHLDLWALTGRAPGVNPMAEWASIDAFCAYRAKPGTYFSSKDVHKTVNQQGFASTPDIGFDKEQGEVRIVFLGESSTAGTGKNLSDEHTWPWNVAQIVQRRLPDRKITFINGAMGGYTSFESFGRLWSRLRFFNPDIVVINHGWNEMYYFANADVAKNWRVRPDGSWGFDTTNAKVFEPMWLDHIIRYSQLLTRVRSSLASRDNGEVGGARQKAASKPATRPSKKKKGSKPVPANEEFDDRALDVWRTNLRLFRDSAKSLHTTIFVCKQPTLIVADLPPAQQKRCRYELHGFGHMAHVRAYQAIYSVIDKEIPSERIIDLTSVSGRPELFYDHVHPTEKGSSEIAALVAEPIIKQLSQAPATQPATKPKSR
jgi:lysophospholipase L1-like esterase